jgi:membrane-bound serine protease (ClpP class)
VRRFRIALRAWLCAQILLVPCAALAAHVNVVRIDGSINPASSDYLQQAIAQSESDGAAALLLELDTPGGLLAATKDIVQAMLNARVPVIVYVAPRGAWAASAGAFITMAGHVAAMAPGTSIGAASPISAGGEGGERDEKKQRKDVAMEKAEKFTAAFIESIARERKRNVEWAQKAVREAEAITAEEALKLHVVDLTAETRADLFRQLEGRKVEVSGQTVTLALNDAEVRVIEMKPMTRLFDFLANPDVAMLLVTAGMLLLFVEFNSPGVILPGVAGVVCLVLAGIAFQIVPFSWVGLLLLLSGVALMAAEIYLGSFGVLFGLGIVCMLIGGSMLFDVPQLSDLTVSFWTVLVPVVAGFAAFAALVVFAVSRTMLSKQTAGVSELIGLRGRVAIRLAPEGKVFVRGEYWNASADEEIASGESVEVTAVEGLHLRVRRADPRRSG